MIDVLTLSLSLALAGAPADLAPVPAVEEPAPVQCADAALAQVPAPLFAAVGDIGALSVTCKVDCDGNGTEETSCTGNTCNAVQRNCSTGQRGYVQCDSNPPINCPPCPECNNGDFRMVRTGQCCDCSFGGEVVHFEECINEQWVTQSTDCGPSASCPICP